MVIAVERNKGYISTYQMDIYADGTGHDEENYGVAERIVKTLLWLYGGYKVTVAGSKKIYEGLLAPKPLKALSPMEVAPSTTTTFFS